MSVSQWHLISSILQSSEMGSCRSTILRGEALWDQNSQLKWPWLPQLSFLRVMRWMSHSNQNHQTNFKLRLIFILLANSSHSLLMVANFVPSGFNMILQQKIGTKGNPPTTPTTKHSKKKNMYAWNFDTTKKEHVLQRYWYEGLVLHYARDLSRLKEFSLSLIIILRVKYPDKDTLSWILGELLCASSSDSFASSTWMEKHLKRGASHWISFTLPIPVMHSTGNQMRLLKTTLEPLCRRGGQRQPREGG